MKNFKNTANARTLQITSQKTEIKLMFFLAFKSLNYWHWTAWVAYAYMLCNYGDIPMLKLSSLTKYDYEPVSDT